MYRKKSEIIEQIQKYHQQVADLYYNLYEKLKDRELKLLMYDLYQHEKFRENNLVRHLHVARAMDFWLDFPDEKLTKQISDCLDKVHADSEMTMEQLIKISMHFDDCLIKLYNILASENELSETVNNVFYYMLKKTKKEKDLIADMMCHSNRKLSYRISV